MSGANHPTAETFDRRRFEQAPCYICGYNGAGYYHSGLHRCAALYHGYKLPQEAPLTSNDQNQVERFEVWSVSHDGLAELARQRPGMGPTDFEQYVPVCDKDVFVRAEEYEQLTRERDQARAELNSTNGHWPEIRRLRAERTDLHGALVRVRLEVSGCPPDCSHDFHRLAIKSAFKIANDALKRSAEPTSAPETNCSDPGWEMRDGDLTCKGCGRKARDIFKDDSEHDEGKASAAALKLFGTEKCPDCGVRYIPGARHFSGCASHPGELAQKADELRELHDRRAAEKGWPTSENGSGEPL